MEKNKKRSSVTKALMWRITALALGLWLFMMCCITWVYAGVIRKEYRENFYASVGSTVSSMESIDPEYVKDNVRQQVLGLDVYNNFPLAMGLPFLNYDANVEPYEYAIVCFDKYEVVDGVAEYLSPSLVGDGNIMRVIYSMTPEVIHIDTAYIDLDETQFGQELVAETKRNGLFSFGYYRLREDVFNKKESFRFDRLTGWFEGDQFHLVEIADYPGNVPLAKEPEDEWITVVDTAEPGQELVHIYPKMPNCIEIKLAATKRVRVDGVTYDNLGDMLENRVLEDRSGIFYSVFSTWDYFQDSAGEVYMMCVAVRVSPLQLAFAGLLKFYSVTLVILAFILFLIYRGIRKKLVAPMNKLLKLVAEDSLYMPEPEDYWWEEPYEVYVQPRNAIHELKKEINQLNAALEYAKDAEDNRKRMISNITHELKTPLAVIHSYAEGLQEGIAGDNQDHYLDVILEETDQIDGMVLEMLDLSRLEAGKVRLASDRFSLPELTKRVFEKLKPLMQEKELEVEFLWSQDYQITADEGRMTQVVTNLTTNAIKYSPEGGKIVVQIYWYNGYFHFTIENQSEPIPEENLKKLWDSFYRTDASRTEKGTGLGLTITKTIVELHGGSCAARNTPNGVQFEFELP